MLFFDGRACCSTAGQASAPRASRHNPDQAQRGLILELMHQLREIYNLKIAQQLEAQPSLEQIGAESAAVASARSLYIDRDLFTAVYESLPTALNWERTELPSAQAGLLDWAIDEMQARDALDAVRTVSRRVRAPKGKLTGVRAVAIFLAHQYIRSQISNRA